MPEPRNVKRPSGVALLVPLFYVLFLSLVLACVALASSYFERIIKTNHTLFPFKMARDRPMDVDMVVTVAITLSIATLLTALRFWARHITKVKLWWDDWTALGAWLIALIYSISTLIWVAIGGLGRRLDDIHYVSPDEAVKRTLIFLFVIELTYAGSLAFSKFAILGMYWRLFSTSPIRRPTQVLFVLSVMWLIIRTFMTIFHCVPTQAFWDHTIKDAVCNIENSKFFFGTTLTHLLLDVAILALPALQVRHLKLRRGQKIGVILLFMFGAVVCIASIILLIAATKLDSNTPEMPYDIIVIIIPATIEVNLAIVSACLPMMRPVVQRLMPNSALGGSSGDNSGYGNKSNHATSTSTGVRLRSMKHGFELRDDTSSTENFAEQNFASSGYPDVERASDDMGTKGGPSVQHGPKTLIESGATRPSSRNAYDSQAIHVKNEMTVKYEDI